MDQPVFFDGWSNIISTSILAPLVYLSIILFIRLSGKRSTSQMNNFDWIVTVAMGSLVGSALVLEDVTLAESLFAIGLLMLLQYLFTFGATHFRWVEKLIKSEPRLLYDNGYRKEAMQKERITESEILAAMREDGIARIEDVRFVVLETDASFSVIGRDAVSDATVSLAGFEKTT